MNVKFYDRDGNVTEEQDIDLPMFVNTNTVYDKGFNAAIEQAIELINNLKVRGLTNLETQSACISVLMHLSKIEGFVKKGNK